ESNLQARLGATQAVVVEVMVKCKRGERRGRCVRPRRSGLRVRRRVRDRRAPGPARTPPPEEREKGGGAGTASGAERQTSAKLGEDAQLAIARSRLAGWRERIPGVAHE